MQRVTYAALIVTISFSGTLLPETIPDTLSVPTVRSFLEIDVEYGAMIWPQQLFYNDSEGIVVAGTVGSRAGTSLLFVDQGFEMHFDALQDYLN